MEHHQNYSREISPSLHGLAKLAAILFLMICLFPLSVQAGEVTLAWDPPSTGYGGFILSYGTTSGNYSVNHDVGRQTTYTIPSLSAGQTYFFAVKAYTVSRNIESPYSNQVVATVPDGDSTPPASPKQVQVQ